MKRWRVGSVGLLVAVLASVLTTGTSSAPAQAQTPAEDRFGSVTTADGERTYRVHLPPGYSQDDPLPLVVGIHGNGLSTADLFAARTGLEDAVEARGWIVVFPDGLRWEDGERTAWNGGICCSPATDLGIDDVGFIDAMLDELTAELAVDTTRIYVAGASGGAILTHRLACELGGRLAAVAPVAGAIDDTASCEPGRAVPILIIHGRRDRHLPFDGGSDLVAGDWPSVAQATDRWRAINRCIGPLRRTMTEVVAIDRWRPCSPEGDVRLIAVLGFPHRWPGTGSVDPYEATPVVLDFFAQHRLLRDFAPNPFTDVVASSFASYAIDWAAATHVLGAASGTRFRPSADVLRSTAVRAIARFLGQSAPATVSDGQRPLTRLRAANLLSDAAGRYLRGSDAVQWARRYSVIIGRPGVGFDAAAVITRAELASALYRLAATPEAWAGGRVDSPHAV